MELLFEVKNQLFNNKGDTKDIVVGSKGYLFGKIDFLTADWDNTVKKVKFLYGPGLQVETAIDGDNRFEFPEEVLNATEFIMSVVGTTDEKIITATSINIKQVKNAFQTGYETLDLTGYLYNQILKMVNGKGDKLEYSNSMLKLLSGETTLSEVPISGGGTSSQIVLRNSGTYIQWKYIEDETWINLVELTQLKGDPGTPGTPGEPGQNFQFTGTIIPDAVTISVTLNPNTNYKTATLATCTSFTILLSAGNWFDEYILYLTIGAVAPTITLPVGIIWVGGTPTFAANKTYLISIQNGIGVVASV